MYNCLSVCSHIHYESTFVWTDMFSVTFLHNGSGGYPSAWGKLGSLTTGGQVDWLAMFMWIGALVSPQLPLVGNPRSVGYCGGKWQVTFFQLVIVRGIMRIYLVLYHDKLQSHGWSHPLAPSIYWIAVATGYASSITCFTISRKHCKVNFTASSSYCHAKQKPTLCVTWMLVRWTKIDFG